VGGIFNDHFIARLLMSLLIKEFWKSVNFWQSYGWIRVRWIFFLTHGVVMWMPRSQINSQLAVIHNQLLDLACYQSFLYCQAERCRWHL